MISQYVLIGTMRNNFDLSSFYFLFAEGHHSGIDISFRDFLEMWRDCNHDHEAAGIRHTGIYSVNCVHSACSSENKTVLGSRHVFDERILLGFFLHRPFHFGVRQRRQKLILHQILDVYPRFSFMNRGC